MKIINDELKPWRPLRRQIGMIEQLRQQQARKPDKADVKNRHAQVSKVSRTQPHENHPQHQRVKTMQPPKLVLMALNPAAQQTLRLRQKIFLACVGIRHFDQIDEIAASMKC